MASIFSKIVTGELPSYKIAENDFCLAFLDINPLAKGHTLVIPKNEVDYIFDLEEDTFKELFIFAQKVARAIKKTIPCARIGMAVVGFEVPHAHIHLVPINGNYDIDFRKAKIKLTQDEFIDIAGKIADAVKQN